MKKKVIMAGAAVIMSAVAVGFSVNTNNNMTDLMSANLEALTSNEMDFVKLCENGCTPCDYTECIAHLSNGLDVYCDLAKSKTSI